MVGGQRRRHARRERVEILRVARHELDAVEAADAAVELLGERDLDRVRREDCDCFAMMVVARRERAGLLAGAVTAAREMFA